MESLSHLLSLFNCIININNNVNPWSGVQYPDVIDINEHSNSLSFLYFSNCVYKQIGIAVQYYCRFILHENHGDSPRFTLPVLLIFSLQAACLLSFSLSDPLPFSTPAYFNSLIPRFYALSCPTAEQIVR